MERCDVSDRPIDPTPSRAARPVDRLLRAWNAFESLEWSRGAVLLAAAALAMIVANSALGPAYQGVLRTPIGVVIGSFARTASLHAWIDDALMAVFFFVIGLEIKREVLVGELSTARKAALPIIAAVGGMLAPALIYLALNAGGPGQHGWGVPVATDIAFALGVLALVRSRVPSGLKVFLLALAIADDIGAMLVIAVAYSSGLHLVWLAAALIPLAALVAFNRTRVDTPWPYAIAGVAFWFCFLGSGLHATVAGVIVALTIPATALLPTERFVAGARKRIDEIERCHVPGAHVLDGGEGELKLLVGRAARHSLAPLQRMENALAPLVDFAVLPLFAFANAGVTIGGVGRGGLLAPVGLGVVLGLVVGKQIGVAAAAWLAVRLGVARLPEGVGWRHIYGAAWLAGIGFTMSMFIANLAFADPALADQARLGVMAASLIAGVGGWLYFALAIPREGSSSV
jgi:Na+:H+ antiporter, NhaA family